MSEALRGSPVKGMIFGVLVDIGGSLLASFALFFIWAIWLGASTVLTFGTVMLGGWMGQQQNGRQP